MWTLWKKKLYQAWRISTFHWDGHIDTRGSEKGYKMLYLWIRMDMDMARSYCQAQSLQAQVALHNVTWRKLKNQQMRCNTDGVCRGYPDISSYDFCLKNNKEDLIDAFIRVPMAPIQK